MSAEFFEENSYENPTSFYRESIGNSRVLVAADTGNMIGFLVFQMLWGNTPFLSLIKVSRDFQKQGVGEKMINIFEEKLRKLNFKKYISSTEAVNEIGQKFHKKMGFKNAGQLDMVFGKEDFFSKDL